jgi:hypothetical protein
MARFSDCTWLAAIPLTEELGLRGQRCPVSHELFGDFCWRVDHCACSCGQEVGFFPGFVGVSDGHGPGCVRCLNVGGGVAEEGCGSWGDVEGVEGLGE